jgi:hypothetical protein
LQLIIDYFVSHAFNPLKWKLIERDREKGDGGLHLSVLSLDVVCQHPFFFLPWFKVHHSEEPSVAK